MASFWQQVSPSVCAFACHLACPAALPGQSLGAERAVAFFAQERGNFSVDPGALDAVEADLRAGAASAQENLSNVEVSEPWPSSLLQPCASALGPDLRCFRPSWLRLGRARKQKTPLQWLRRGRRLRATRL